MRAVSEVVQGVAPVLEEGLELEVYAETASRFRACYYMAEIHDGRMHTEVSRRPGSPKEDLQDMSNFPSGTLLPGGYATGNGESIAGDRMYTYWRMSCGCMSAIEC